MISLISTQSTPPRLHWVIYNQCTDGAQSNNYNYGLSTTSTDRHSRGKHFHTQLKLSMSVLREYTTAAFFTYFSKVHLTDILRINWHFRQQFYYYFQHLFLWGFVSLTIWLPTKWHHPCIRAPVERDSWFPAIQCHISMAMPHRTDMGTKFHIELTWVQSMCCNYNNRQITQRRLQLSCHQHHRQTTTDNYQPSTQGSQWHGMRDNTPSQLSTFNPGLPVARYER